MVVVVVAVMVVTSVAAVSVLLSLCDFVVAEVEGLVALAVSSAQRCTCCRAEDSGLLAKVSGFRFGVWGLLRSAVKFRIT